MKIVITEAAKSTPEAPIQVWRVFRDGREVAMGIYPGTRDQAEVEARLAAEISNRRRSMKPGYRSADVALALDEWRAMFGD